MITNTAPKISVIIPSYNQGRYLETTIQSVLQQDYPHLEIIVMDGGSTDNSVDIIKRYQQYFTYWQSKPDGGQPAAIVAGFQRATGNILTWLNSDDILLPGALNCHAKTIQSHPGADVFFGNHIVIDETGNVIDRFRHPVFYRNLAWLTAPYIAQPGTTFTRRIWDQVGGLDVQMHCAFDYDLWYRFMAAHAQFIHVGQFVAGFRKHPESKGAVWLNQYAQEYALLKERYRDYFGSPFAGKMGRLALMALQILNGAYLHTLSFRIQQYFKSASRR